MDPTLVEFVRAMEQALRPGVFIKYGVSHDFVRGLESVAQRLNDLALTDPGSAVQLYETFIGACHEKAEELDDSGGSLAMFVQQLFANWVRARQAAGHDPADTVRCLIARIDDDPYGFCLHLEPHVAKVMDAQHLETFTRLARERLQQTAPDDRGPAGYPRRRWAEALKHVLAAQRDVEAYVELCRASGLSAADCSVVAKMIEHLGRPEEALAWVEQGLSLARTERLVGGAEYELKKRHRELLRRLGRVAEAVASAWAEFDEHPSQFSYRTLLELAPADQRHTWQSRALARGESADLGSAISLFIEANDTDRLDACRERPTLSWKSSATTRRSRRRRHCARRTRISPPACTVRSRSGSWTPRKASTTVQPCDTSSMHGRAMKPPDLRQTGSLS